MALQYLILKHCYLNNTAIYWHNLWQLMSVWKIYGYRQTTYCIMRHSFVYFSFIIVHRLVVDSSSSTMGCVCFALPTVLIWHHSSRIFVSVYGITEYNISKYKANNNDQITCTFHYSRITLIWPVANLGKFLHCSFNRHLLLYLDLRLSKVIILTIIYHGNMHAVPFS